MHIEKGADFLVTQERGTLSPSPPHQFNSLSIEKVKLFNENYELLHYILFYRSSFMDNNDSTLSKPQRSNFVLVSRPNSYNFIYF